MTDIATLPLASPGVPLTRLIPAELARRRAEIQRAIRGSIRDYPFAAANLQHWLDNSGSRRDIALTVFNFLDNNCGLPGFLMSRHRPIIAIGHRTGFDHVAATVLGVEGRLRLPPTDARSLPPGITRTIDWQDSVRANMFDTRSYRASPALERDLSIALGGYTVHSQVQVRAGSPVSSAGHVRQEVEVISWRVQICDRYDWIVGTQTIPFIGVQVTTAQAPIIVPSDIPLPPIPAGAGTVRTYFGHRAVVFNDSWMAQVEQSGGARSYVIFSEVFDAPQNVRANFVATDGTIRV